MTVFPIHVTAVNYAGAEIRGLAACACTCLHRIDVNSKQKLLLMYHHYSPAVNERVTSHAVVESATELLGVARFECKLRLKLKYLIPLT